MKKLYLIRHGQTAALPLNQYCGSSDIDVSPDGFRLLEQLRRQGGYPDLTGLHVYTSGMKRTEQTLAALYGPVAHDVLKDFREIDFGDLELVSEEEVVGTPRFMAWWGGDHPEQAFPHGESWTHLRQRARHGAAQLAAKDEDAIVFSHGGLIGGLMCELFPQQGNTVADWLVECGHGYVIAFDQGRPTGWQRLPHRDDDGWRDSHYAFVQNRSCEFFPCHKVDKALFNCLFCYCPLYPLGDGCGGDFTYLPSGIKDCSACAFPHERDNYKKVLERLAAVTEMARRR